MKHLNSIFSDDAFRVLAETAADAFIIINALSEILYVNSKVKDVFGYTENELLSKNIDTIVPEKYREGHKKGVERFLSTKEPHIVGHTVEIEGLHKDGSIFPIELSLSHWEKDGVNYFTSIIRDISERKKIYQELNLLQHITQSIFSAEDFTSALKVTIQKCCEVLDWDYGEVWIPDSGKNNIIFGTVWFSNEEERIHAFLEKSKQLKVPLTKGMASKVFQGEIFWNPDLSSPDNVFSRAADSVEAGFYSCIGIPVKSNEEVVVSFLLFSKRKRTEDETIKNVISAIARQLGELLEKKKTEDFLKEREYFIRQIANSTPDIITVYDFIEQKAVYSNREVGEILGYKKEDIESWDNKLIFSKIHPDDLMQVLEKNKKLENAADGEKTESEYRLLANNGEWKWVRSRSTVFKRTVDGRIQQVLSLLSDITDKKTAENQLLELYAGLEEKVAERTKELKESEERFSLVLKYSELGIWDTDFAHNKRNVDERARELFGIEPGQELSYDFVMKVLHLDDVPKFQQAFKHSLQQETGGVLSVDYRIIHPKSGETIWLRSQGKSIFNESGVAVRSLGTVLDITKQKNSEEEIKKKNNELQKINNDLDNFIYTASHDLKAPVSNIEGLLTILTTILANKGVDAGVSEILPMIEKSINRFKKTISELTDVSRVQKELNDPEEGVFLPEIISDVKDDIADQIASSQAIIHTDFSRLESVHFSKKNLRSIFYNFISNSIKYQDPARRPEIFIHSEQKDKRVFLTFSDNGLGFDDTRLSLLFGMFKRLHNHVEGSGVGLYIVKKIVENAGGVIHVKSTIGKGSEFIVELPVGMNQGIKEEFG